MEALLRVLKSVVPALEVLLRELEEEGRKASAKASESESGAVPRARKGEPIPQPWPVKALSVTEASHMLGLCKSTIYKLVGQRAVPYYKIGVRVLFDEQKLRSWMEDREVEPNAIWKSSHQSPRRSRIDSR